MTRFSTRAADLRPSPIRDILAAIERPGMISFAGGLPATETLPAWSGTVQPAALQYGATEGDPDLRALVADRLQALGLDAPPERVLILSGSQQGIDLVAKLFVDPGTPVALESPTYLAALQAFRFFGASFAPLRWDEQPEAPLTYVVPTFANPTGACASAEQRDALAASCLRGGVTLFEDDPYRDLDFTPEAPAGDRTPIATRMAGGSWIYQGSFSKILAPGLRLGFLAASEDLFTQLVRVKQATDLHSSRLGQRVAASALTDPGWDARLRELVAFYRGRRDGFDAALRNHLGDLGTWEVPEGGLFFWLRLNSPTDTRQLLPRALEQSVAFMPGEDFYPGAAEPGRLRLNYSHASADAAERGLATLASLLR